jgi:hypothetical protein
MSARDALHETVRKALEKAGWTITADPLRVVYGSDVMLVDLGAERLIAAERGGERIGVEIKGYTDTTNINGFHSVIGQYINYRLAMKTTHPDHQLVLAIPEEVFNTFFKRDFAQLAVKENKILLFVFDPKDEVIVHENR